VGAFLLLIFKIMKIKQEDAGNLKIHHIPLSELNPAPYNPRKWDEESVKNLTESIKRYGLIDPIICNSAPKRKNVVVGGHFRLHIAEQLGYKEMPVVFVNIPSIKKEKELNLRLNRNTGDWDFELLKNFDVDLLLDVGFDDSDLSHIWDEQLETEEDGFNEEKELEKIKRTKIQEGDVYKLGDHLLFCANSTNPDLFKGWGLENQISMIYTDPVYNIGLSYNKGMSGKNKYGGQEKDKKSEKEYKEFLTDTLLNGLSICRKDTHIFYYCDQKYIGMLQDIYSEQDIESKRVALWIKNGFNATPNSAFNKCYEPCVYGTIGKPRLSPVKNLDEVLNKEIGSGNRAIDDILDMLDIWLVKRLSGQDYEHPTQKPITLAEKPLRRCTKPGDKVLDLFGGSGSTLLACEQLKRKCVMVELDPIFCQLIINRYESYANTKAKKIN
jgi:DNA modification methylase